MKKLILYVIYAALLAACSAPKVKQPFGEWTPVNKPATVKG